MYNSLKILSGFFQISEGILQKYAETVDNSSKFVRDILEIFNNIDFFLLLLKIFTRLWQLFKIEMKIYQLVRVIYRLRAQFLRGL